MFQKKRHKPLKQSCVILLLPEVWPQKSCKQIHTSDGALFRPPKTLPSPCLCYCNTKKPVHGQSMQTSKTALKQNESKHLARALDFTHHTNLVIPCFEGGKSFTWGIWLSPKLWHKPKILQKGNCKLSEIWNFPFKCIKYCKMPEFFSNLYLTWSGSPLWYPLHWLDSNFTLIAFNLIFN